MASRCVHTLSMHAGASWVDLVLELGIPYQCKSAQALASSSMKSDERGSLNAFTAPITTKLTVNFVL